MAAPMNPCCEAWRKKCSKLDTGRQCLKQAIDVLQKQIDKIQSENASLKKAYEEEQARAEAQKREREGELAVRISLENQISMLKSEISALKQLESVHSDVKDGEVKVLQDCVAKGEEKINQLEALLENEKIRAESEKNNAEAEKKRWEEKRVLFEKEIVALKSEVFMLGQKGSLTAEDMNGDMKLLQDQVLKGEKEINRLKELHEKEKKREDFEKKNAEAEKKKWKEREIAMRVSLENEISALKSEISSLRAKGNAASEAKIGEIKLLEDRVSKEENEINRLKKLLEKEKLRANSEKKIAEAEKKSAAEAWVQMKAEKAKADEMKRQAGVVEKEAEEYRLQLEVLKKEADEARSKLVSETLRFEEAKRTLEAEKCKLNKERKRANSEMARAEKQRKLSEASGKMEMEEKSRADQLSHQLEEDRHKIEEMQKQIEELLSYRKSVEVSAILPHKDMITETAKVKLLEQQLKLEKMRLKHAKQVTKLEKGRNSLLQKELGRLKLDFVQMMHRLDSLDKCFSTNRNGTKSKEKPMDFAKTQKPKLKRTICDLEPLQMHHEGGTELLKPNCMAMVSSDSLRKTFECVAPLFPNSRGCCTESISGIDFKLEPLLGGSNQKMFLSSAINSSSASFSDGQLVGSQERGAFVAASDKFEEENLNAPPTISSMSCEVTRTQHNENLAVEAENSVRSSQSVDNAGRVNGHGRKRRRMLDVIESAELLCSEGKKLHLMMEEKLSHLQCMLKMQTDKQIEERNNMEPKCTEHERFIKNVEVPDEDEVIVRHSFNIQDLTKAEKIQSEALNNASDCVHTPSPADDPAGNFQVFMEGELQTMASFEEVVNGNYMKLLDLDDAYDEECYRRAMEVPISPALPEIGFLSAELSGFDLHGGLPNEKNILAPARSFDVTDLEISSNNSKHNTAETFCNELVHANDGPDNASDVLGIMSGFHSSITAQVSRNKIEDSGAGVKKSNINDSINEGLELPSESEHRSASESLPAYCVMFSDVKDSRSISRVYYATRTCMAQCSLKSQTECMVQGILHELKMEEKISPKEKTCALFTLLLLNVSACVREKSANFAHKDFVLFLDSFARNISAVVSDVQTRSLFTEVCCLDELLHLVEEFLIDGIVMLHTDVCSETLSESDTRISIFMDGAEINLSPKSATSDQLVAGSIILASICVAVDYVGFIYEASYYLLRMHKCDIAVVLTILHIFAYLGGEKFFSQKKYGWTMSVLKSIVIFLEGGNPSMASSCHLSSMHEAPSANCPYSVNAVSTDDVASLLLEKLECCAVPGIMHQPCVESANISNSNVLCHYQSLGCKELHSAFNVDHDASYSFDKMPAIEFDRLIHGSFYDASDVLSLLELLACKMNWEWTCSRIIPELLKLLERPELDKVAVAVVLLLGQLGRLGISACGYVDKEVDDLRCKLSAFLRQSTTVLPVQIAIVTALLELLPCDFEDVIQSNLNLSGMPCQFVITDIMRNWFFSLSKEQKAFMLSLLKSVKPATS